MKAGLWLCADCIPSKCEVTTRGGFYTTCQACFEITRDEPLSFATRSQIEHQPFSPRVLQALDR